jgi:hypothetical protein
MATYPIISHKSDENRKKVDALDIPLLGMVVVPANNIIFIGVRFFGNTAIHDHDTFSTPFSSSILRTCGLTIRHKSAEVCFSPASQCCV